MHTHTHTYLVDSAEPSLTHSWHSLLPALVPFFPSHVRTQVKKYSSLMLDKANKKQKRQRRRKVKQILDSVSHSTVPPNAGK